MRGYLGGLLVAAVLALLAASAGLRAYANHQWRAAQRAVAEERPAEARQRLKFCLRVWPKSVEVHLLAARAARLELDFEDAEFHLNRCLQLANGATEPIQLEFLLMRAQTGEVDDVAPALLKCVDENHSESKLILETLARTYMHRLEYQHAYACLTHWIKQDASAAKAYHWRGWVQERLNNSKRAMEDYQKALELNPDLTLVRLRVAEMLLEDKQPLEALAHLERLQKQMPDSPEVKARLGQCRYLQGRLPEARRLLEEAVKEIPNDQPLLLHLGRLDLDEDRPAEAERWLRRLLEIDPTDTEAHNNLVTVLQLQGRREEAKVELELWQKNHDLLERLNKLLKQEAERPGPDAARAAEIGSLLLQVGQQTKGLHWLFTALDRDANQQSAHRALADYYKAKGDKTKEAAHRRWLREPDPAGERNTKQPADKPVH